MGTVRRYLFASLLLAVGASPLWAGSNAGFKVNLNPREIRDPVVGQRVSAALGVEQIVAGKQSQIQIAYDPRHIGNVQIAPGPFIPVRLPLPAAPDTLSNGLVTTGYGLSGSSTVSGAGVLYTINFEIIGPIPDEGTMLSITKVRVGADASDFDEKTAGPNQFGIKLVKSFSNAIFDLETIRGRDNAALTWRTQRPGITDTVLVRAKGESIWQTFTNPLAKRVTPRMFEAIRTLLEKGLVPREISDEQFRTALQSHPSFENFDITAEFIKTVRVLDEALGNRRHLVEIKNLTPNTEYEFVARSYDVGGKPSRPFTGFFNTRLSVDKRPVFIERFEVQSSPFSAVIRWFTNRPADTRYFFRSESDADVTEVISNEDGTQVHVVEIRDLEPNKRYDFTIGSRLINWESLIEEGMSEQEVKKFQPRYLYTRPIDRRLRFLGPPFYVVGADGARLRVRLNQPANMRLEYGELEDGVPLRQIPIAYTDTVSSEELSTEHDIAIGDLSSNTRYRFRITAYNDIDTLDTDPRGDKLWNRDFHFRTSSSSDTLAPVIVSGPQVIVRGEVAIVRWATDVPTTSSVYVGEWETDTTGMGGSGTLGTSDEFEFSSLNPNGSARFARHHVITLTGLNLSTRYGYRLEATGPNGKTVAFDPNNSSAMKRAKVLQPPGGSGQFTTDSTADTQFPVILSGPYITSQTHSSAVVEWTTDEPANSEVEFGDAGLDNSEASGDNQTTHKIVLSDLEAGTTYNYIIGSTDAAGNGATQSAMATFTTNPDVDITAPEIIEGPEIVYKNDESATVHWTTDEESTGSVDFGLTEDLGTVRTLSTSATKHEVTLTNLSANETYYYTVASSDLSNNGPTVSDTLSFTTDAEPDLSSPVITSVNYVVSDSLAIIGWTTDELSDSFVEFGTDSLALDFNVGSTEGTTDHSITLTNLTPDQTYYFVAGSTDRAGNPSSKSDRFEFTTLSSADTTAPAVPTDLSATEGSRQVVLEWDGQIELDLNGFNVYRSDQGGAFTLLSSGVQKTRYTDLNVDNETSYAYYVTSIDKQNPPNESASSDTVSATPTSSAAPSTPSELGRSGDYLRPTFFFTNANSFNVGGTLTYEIQVSSESDFSSVTASTSNLAENSGDIGTGQTGWTLDRELTEGATYYWRVRAVEGELTSDFSVAEEFVVVDPSALAGDFNGDGSVTFDDFFLFVDFFGQSATGDAASYDLDGGGSVDFNDFFIFVDNFGKTLSGKRWAAPQANDDSAIFSLEAHGGTRTERNELTVYLSGNQIEDLSAYGAVLEYDPNILRFDRATPGPGHLLGSQGGQAPFFTVFWQRPGQVVVGNGLIKGESISGNGLLAELQFTRIGDPNKAAIHLREGYTASPTLGVRSVVALHSTVLRPEDYALQANFPNPFNPSTSIEYALPESSPVQLIVYDILGQQVRELVSRSSQNAGFYRVEWDGLDSRGNGVGSGIYFYRLETPRFTHTRKMMLIK